ncbi:MAG: rane protein involved in the export of O-antigen and teichoic acid [Chlorobi bacterium]|nr:rane protein involved in the export of O-antigen and teichoic acid [Chlorobiota bacterium]
MWKKIGVNSISYLALTIFKLAFGLWYTPYLLHKIGALDFALITFISSIFGFSGLLDIGLRPTLVKLVAAKHARGDHEGLQADVSAFLTLFTIIGFVAGVLLSLVGIALPYFTHIPPERVHIYAILFAISAVQAFYNFPLGTLNGILNGLQDNVMGSFIQFFTVVATGIYSYVLLTTGYGVVALNVAAMIVGLLVVPVSIWRVKRLLPGLRFRFRRVTMDEVRGYSRFSGVMFISNIAESAIRRTDQLIIAMFLPLVNVATYQIGTRLHDYSRMPMEQVVGNIFPAASALAGKGEREKLYDLIFRGTKYIIMIYLPIYALLICYGGEFITLWVGKDFAGAYWVMILLVSGSLYHAVDAIPQWCLLSQDRTRNFTRANIAGAVVNLILCVVLVNTPLGIYGIALAALLTYLFVGVPFGWFVRRELGFGFPEMFRRSILGPLISVIPIFLLRAAYTLFPLRWWSWTAFNLVSVLLMLGVYLIFFADDRERRKIRSVRDSILGRAIPEGAE